LTHVYEYDTVVLGSDLRALLFAFNNRLPVVFAEQRRPFRFDYFNNEDLSCLQIENVQKTLKTPRGADKTVGIAKHVLWERLLFFLSLEGRIPLADICDSIRYNGDRFICSNEYSKIAEIAFNKCYYFGDNKALGIEKKVVDKGEYICYDWISFKRGGKHDIDYIKTRDPFVNEIWFYSSDRIEGNTGVKDACVASRIKYDDILDFDFSETAARFKMEEEMYKRGMKGPKRQQYRVSDGTPYEIKYTPFRTVYHSRRKTKDKITTSTRENRIKVTKTKESTLLGDLPAACLDYDRLVRHFAN